MRAFIIAGTMVRDPEVKTNKNGKKYCTFSLAVRENKDKSHFFNMTAWEGQAELLSKMSYKGQRMTVMGDLVYAVYEEAGEKRYQTSFFVRQITFQTFKSKDESGAGKSSGSDFGGEIVDGPPFESNIPFDDDIPF